MTYEVIINDGSVSPPPVPVSEKDLGADCKQCCNMYSRKGKCRVIESIQSILQKAELSELEFTMMIFGDLRRDGAFEIDLNGSSTRLRLRHSKNTYLEKQKLRDFLVQLTFKQTTTDNTINSSTERTKTKDEQDEDAAIKSFLSLVDLVEQFETQLLKLHRAGHPEYLENVHHFVRLGSSNAMLSSDPDDNHTKNKLQHNVDEFELARFELESRIKKAKQQHKVWDKSFDSVRTTYPGALVYSRRELSHLSILFAGPPAQVKLLVDYMYKQHEQEPMIQTSMSTDGEEFDGSFPILSDAQKEHELSAYKNIQELLLAGDDVKHADDHVVCRIFRDYLLSPLGLAKNMDHDTVLAFKLFVFSAHVEYT